MEHHTTLNLKITTYCELKKLAEAMETSISTAIVALMKYMSKEVEHRKMPERLVEYQKPTEGEEWHTCHVYWSFQEYQHFTDMRNFLKMSVSFLVATALQKYGHQLLNSTSPDLWDDNNLFPHYSLVKKTASGVQFFLICWGKTGKYPDMNSPG